MLQPWAWAIAHGGKTVENRSRRFSHRGPLAIHAGRAWEPVGATSPQVKHAFDAYRLPAVRDRDLDADHPKFVTGAVIAVTELVDVHRETGGCCQPWGHTVNLSAAAADRPVYHLVLSGTRALDEPVRCYGAQGLWNLPSAVAEALR